MKKVSELLLVGLILAAPFFAIADEYLKSVPAFNLEDHLGKVQNIENYTDKDYVVLFVQGVGCPISRIALPSLRKVRDEFTSQNVEFMMFNANIQDNLKRISSEAEEFSIDFPIIKDEGQVLAKSLGVERTAEAFVIDPRTKKVVFRGPINDKIGYETQKNESSHEYLKDALDTLLAGGTVNMDDVPDSKGCLVAIFDT